jgi:hypothetical protein
MTTIKMFNVKKNMVLNFIIHKKKVKQPEIINTFKDVFGYNTKNSIRMGFSDILRGLKKEGLVEKIIDEKSKTPIKENYWVATDRAKIIRREKINIGKAIAKIGHSELSKDMTARQYKSKNVEEIHSMFHNEEYIEICDKAITDYKKDFW